MAANPSHIASAIDYATQKRVDVINLSLNSSEQSSLVDAAIGRALALGIHIVVSAGNSGASEPEYPANLPGVIAAGELNASGRLQPWSSGPGSSGSQYVATQVKGMKTAYLGGRTVSALGTSSAAAKITGILASLRMNAASQWMSALRDLASTPRLRRR